MAAHGRFAWNELNTHDPEAAKRFCAESFGWSWDAMPTPVLGGGTYWSPNAATSSPPACFR